MTFQDTAQAITGIPNALRSDAINYITAQPIVQGGVTYAGNLFGTISNTVKGVQGTVAQVQQTRADAQTALDMLRRANPFNQQQAQNTANYQNPGALIGNEVGTGTDASHDPFGMNNQGGPDGLPGGTTQPATDWLGEFGQRALFFLLGLGLVLVGVVFIAQPSVQDIDQFRLKRLQIGELKASSRERKRVSTERKQSEKLYKAADADRENRPPGNFFTNAGESKSQRVKDAAKRAKDASEGL